MPDPVSLYALITFYLLGVISSAAVFSLYILSDSHTINLLEYLNKLMSKDNYLKKLVGNKVYRTFLSSEDQVNHAYEYLINIYPIYEKEVSSMKPSYRCLRKDDINNMAKQIIHLEASKKLDKIWWPW